MLAPVVPGPGQGRMGDPASPEAAPYGIAEIVARHAHLADAAGRATRTASAPLTVAQPRIDSGDLRLVAEVAGRPFFFGANRPLEPAIEAPLASFALHSFALGLPLRASAPVDATFYANLVGLAAIQAHWQGWPDAMPVLETELPLVEAPSRATGSGLFFTCGVDSFYSLLRWRRALQALIHVEGFDFPLDDRGGNEAMRRRIGSVAEACGLEAITVRTDLRSHPLFAALSWERTHIAALGAVAQSLRSCLGHVFVASSGAAPPHASHPALDRLYGSSFLSMENDGDPMRRIGKVVAIAGWDLVHRNLQVCWQGRPGHANCGRCEKCLRTRAMFQVAGALERLETLPGTSGLVRDIAALPRLAPHLVVHWRSIAEAVSEPSLRGAVEDLLAHSAGLGLRERLRSAAPGALRRQVRNARMRRALRAAWPPG